MSEWIRLEDENADLKAALAAAREENRRLREALEEFFNDGMPEFSEESWYDEEGVEGTTIQVFRHGWEQRFRAALAREDGNGNR